MDFNLTEKLSKIPFLREQNGKNFIVFLGIAGILLILFSDLSSCEKKETQKADAEFQSVQGDYGQHLESQLSSIISSISGVGEARVMVTLSGSGEYVYVNQEKKSVDTSNDLDSKRSSESVETSASPVIISAGGGEQALIRSEKMPSVKGVVVVCEGGGDPVVRQRVISAVTTALDISSQKVCITLLSENN